MPINYKAGYAAIVGRPNVGKSTLLNFFLGQKVAAVSPRPQTTRRKQLGILTLENAQVIFVDTPGLHKPHHKLGEFMNEEASGALDDADVIVWMVEVNEMPNEEDILIGQRLAVKSELPPTLLALNKADLLREERLPEHQAAYQSLLPKAVPYLVSAVKGQGCSELLQAILLHLPEGQPFFSEEEITDFYERDIAAELVREAALIHLREEVPHGIAVRIDEFTERGEVGAHILATLFVEKESHKGIVIGQGGEMLKKIGTAARQEIEKMSGRKVFLELRVKVNKNWRNDVDALRLMGYSHKED
ncbi:MAG: GTPase Era [Anaerolineaceae bacterium]|jgi:GTP-binding protein Era